jgi:hypothetical protein
MFWSHQGVWHEYSADVAAIYKSVTLLPPTPETYTLEATSKPQLVQSKKHRYEVELPAGWNFEESGPEERVVVGRLWTGPGFPFAHVMAIHHPDKPDLSFLDEYLGQLPAEQKPEVVKKKQTGDVVLAEYANTMGPVRYQSLIMTIKRGSFTLCLQAWCKAEEYKRFEEVFGKVAGSFRLLKE